MEHGDEIDARSAELTQRLQHGEKASPAAIRAALDLIAVTNSIDMARAVIGEQHTVDLGAVLIGSLAALALVLQTKPSEIIESLGDLDEGWPNLG